MLQRVRRAEGYGASGIGASIHRPSSLAPFLPPSLPSFQNFPAGYAMNVRTCLRPPLALALGAAFGAFLAPGFGSGSFFGLAAPLMAQHAGHHAGHDGAPAVPAEVRVPLYDGLGPYARPVGAQVSEAATYVQQGIALTYGFAHAEGVRSFREASRIDPTCAFCAWAEAWALGPHINGRMGNAAAREAFAAIEQARTRADGIGAGALLDVERALIEALAVRYAPDPETASRAQLDTLYAQAMDAVARQHPGDLEVRALAGEAWMVLEPWAYWTETGEARPHAAEALRHLEAALAIDVTHPGACHLYIHLVEASPDPWRALPCADHLADMIPGVSHIPHMPAHVLMRTGRYGEAVRGNQRAWIADQRARFDGPPAVYPSHNLHMLFFAAAFDGQSAVALQAARDVTRIAPAFSIYIPLGHVRFGRWEEILELPVLDVSPFATGVSHYARGMAYLRTGGSAAEVNAEIEALERARDQVDPEARFRGHVQRDLLGIAHGTLLGERMAAEGDLDGAVRTMEGALALERALNYDEPEPWPIPVRHTLGAVLLEGGRAAEAEAVYREALAIHPDNGWSLHGLATALRAQGKDAEAAEAEARFQAMWVRADVWITGSRF
jgi:tetratricopeptide (TPR) repeat protein